jgi:predicted ABC-type ATPase
MIDQPPKVVILAGPNGAGKSTSAARLLLGAMRVDEFVNADTIARGLSAFAPERVALNAGRIMLRRIKELSAERAGFAFETTLATRSYPDQRLWSASFVSLVAERRYGRRPRGRPRPRRRP